MEFFPEIVLNINRQIQRVSYFLKEWSNFFGGGKSSSFSNETPLFGILKIVSFREENLVENEKLKKKNIKRYFVSKSGQNTQP